MTMLPKTSRSKFTPRGVQWMEKRKQVLDGERKLEKQLIESLAGHGIKGVRQVITSCGIADVVTDDTVYEVKVALTREVLFKAFAQVTLYATALEKPRRVIVGYEVEGCEGLTEMIRAQGVEINVVP